MSAGSSSPAGRRKRSALDRAAGLLADRRGAVLAYVGIIMVVLLGFLGLALDSARGYVARSRLSRAVDASALAGARALRQGQDVARARAITLAAANGVSAGTGATIAISFSKNGFDEDVVTVSADENLPTTFMRVLGKTDMDVQARAAAAVPPLDLALVLDQSGSLGAANAFDDLQNAAKNFVDKFSDQIDQLSLSSFQVRAGDHFDLDHPFKLTIRSKVDGMVSAGDTNSREGLRYGYNQLKGPKVRTKSVRVLVFFTDGRPTAFRGMLGGQDRAMAVSTIKTGTVRGYFNNPDALPLDRLATPSGCRGAATCFGMNEDQVRTKARTDAEEMASTIRQDKIFIYTIGLGDPKQTDPLLIPDMDFLRRVANENGMVSPSQPQGKAYFAPSGPELDGAFQAMAQDILVRLSE